MNRFDLQVAYGDFTLAVAAAWDAPRAALFGPSGSGKTTILEAIAGLRPEVRGTIHLGSRRIDGLDPAARRIGWVPQEAALFPHMTVRSNLDFAVAARGDAAKARQAVCALEIAELLERRAGELSGGERQRVAIARALASDPDVLLLDEPLASVDRPLRARIVPYLARIPEETGVPLLFITHDPHEVFALADHVVVLQRGAVAAAGGPRDVLLSPEVLSGLEALGAENLFEVETTGRRGGALDLETTNGCALTMAAVVGFDLPRRVAIRAEDIILATDRPRAVSAQNVLAGQVTGLDRLGERVYVRIAAGGEAWVAQVTPLAVEQLGLEAGVRLHLLIKAHAIHPSV